MYKRQELRWEKRQAKEVQQARREEMEKYKESHSNTFPPARDSLEGMVQQVVGDTVFVIPEVAHEQRHLKVCLLYTSLCFGSLCRGSHVDLGT